MNIAIGIAIYFLTGYIALILSIRFGLVTETNDKYNADALLTMFLWPILIILAIVYLIINSAEKIANIGKKK